MSRTLTVIGPQDHGRRMSLDEFEFAEGREGYIYELSRGVITVMDVPHPKHFAMVNAVRRQFAAYDIEHPARIYGVAGGMECKVLLADLESERHPDLAVYTSPPPGGRDVWSRWIPEIVVEVVSPGSEQRDYVEKREEYLAFGVREYWIVDAEKQQVLVLARSRGRWAEQAIRPPAVYRTPLLPGFELDGAAVFEAAAAVQDD